MALKLYKVSVAKRILIVEIQENKSIFFLGAKIYFLCIFLFTFIFSEPWVKLVKVKELQFFTPSFSVRLLTLPICICLASHLFKDQELGAAHCQNTWSSKGAAGSEGRRDQTPLSTDLLELSLYASTLHEDWYLGQLIRASHELSWRSALWLSHNNPPCGMLPGWSRDALALTYVITVTCLLLDFCEESERFLNGATTYWGILSCYVAGEWRAKYCALPRRNS